MRAFKLFLIVLLIPLLALSIFLIVKIYRKHKSSNATERANGGSQEKSNDGKRNLNKSVSIISNLNKDIKEYKKMIEAKSNVTVVDVPLENCSEIMMKNKQKFYRNNNTVLVNAADSRFETWGGGINKVISNFVLNKNGVTNNKWTGLMSPVKYPKDTRIKISNFKNGYVLHLVGLQAKELQRLNLKIEDIEEYIISLYLNGLDGVESMIGQGNVLLCFVSTGVFANDGVDSKGKRFSKNEFALRAKLACFKAIQKYNGKLNIVLNLR